MKRALLKSELPNVGCSFQVILMKQLVLRNGSLDSFKASGEVSLDLLKFSLEDLIAAK